MRSPSVHLYSTTERDYIMQPLLGETDAGPFHLGECIHPGQVAERYHVVVPGCQLGPVCYLILINMKLYSTFVSSSRDHLAESLLTCGQVTVHRKISRDGD
jgi:hypothetical protein